MLSRNSETVAVSEQFSSKHSTRIVTPQHLCHVVAELSHWPSQWLMLQPLTNSDKNG